MAKNFMSYDNAADLIQVISDKINGIYLEQLVTLSTSDVTTVTFTKSEINSNSIIEYICSKWGIVPDDIVTTTGTCTITLPKVTTAETVTVGIKVTNKDGKEVIYGAQWDGSSSTAWTRTDGAANLSNPNPYYSGMSDSPSSPFDNIMPWAGMITVERTGGTMVAIPKFYYNISRPTGYSNGLKIQISMSQKDGFICSPAHMDRGDGYGEREVIYIGRYHCGSSTHKSKTGETPYNTQTRSTMRTTIHNLGSNIWQMDFATRFTIWLLYLVEFANWNSQDCIGYGCSDSGSIMTMGYTDNMPYHTGTTASSKTTYGGTQYRNIEGLWDNVYDWIDGAYYNSSGLNIILNPSNFSDSSGGTAVGVPSSGYPSAFGIKTVNGTYPLIIPTAANGSQTTFSCDYWYFVASSPCLCGGGYYYGQSLNPGLFCMGCDVSSKEGVYLGCRLMELP